MLTTQLEEMIAINSARLMKSARKHRTMRSSNPENNQNIVNWISINRSKFYVKNSIPRRRTQSLDQGSMKFTEQRFVSFQNPTIEFYLKNKAKTRCNSTGNSTVSFVEDDSPHKLCKTDRKTREIESSLGLKRKTQGNLIKGLKSTKMGFPIKKMNLGAQSFVIRGTKLK